MSLPSSMADFVPCDRLLEKAYCKTSALFVFKSTCSYCATEISKVLTEAQSSGIHDLLINLFNTELAMHYRVIFKYSCCFVSGEILCCHVLVQIFHDKSKTGPE